MNIIFVYSNRVNSTVEYRQKENYLEKPHFYLENKVKSHKIPPCHKNIIFRGIFKSVHLLDIQHHQTCDTRATAYYQKIVDTKIYRVRGGPTHNNHDLYFPNSTIWISLKGQCNSNLRSSKLGSTWYLEPKTVHPVRFIL